MRHRSQTTIPRYTASPSYSLKTSLLLVARRAALRRDERDTTIAAPGVASRAGRPVGVAHAVGAVGVGADFSAVQVADLRVLL